MVQGKSLVVSSLYNLNKTRFCLPKKIGGPYLSDFLFLYFCQPYRERVVLYSSVMRLERQRKWQKYKQEAGRISGKTNQLSGIQSKVDVSSSGRLSCLVQFTEHDLVFGQMRNVKFNPRKRKYVTQMNSTREIMNNENQKCIVSVSPSIKNS